MKKNYERHLPHQIPEGKPIFLTWNLKGAFPADVVELIRQEGERLKAEPSREGESTAERKIRHAKIAFAMSDRFLDTASGGPLDLSVPANASIVEGAILFGAPDRYDLFAWCIMANHVHILLQPRWELAKITKGIKGFSAHQINKTQNQRGRVFWQDESYDHWARDDEELFRIISYIENNPVVARLCRRPEDWAWSSARFRDRWQVGQAFQREFCQSKTGKPDLPEGFASDGKSVTLSY